MVSLSTNLSIVDHKQLLEQSQGNIYTVIILGLCLKGWFWL